LAIVYQAPSVPVPPTWSIKRRKPPLSLAIAYPAPSAPVPSD
jgi:hypothetical protein